MHKFDNKDQLAGNCRQIRYGWRWVTGEVSLWYTFVPGKQSSLSLSASLLCSELHSSAMMPREMESPSMDLRPLKPWTPNKIFPPLKLLLAGLLFTEMKRLTKTVCCFLLSECKPIVETMKRAARKTKLIYYCTKSGSECGIVVKSNVFQIANNDPLPYMPYLLYGKYSSTEECAKL